MKVKKLLSNDIISLTGDAGLENEVTKGYTCDLLSWVMAKGDMGCAWITVQNNMNVLAVASMMDFSCIIISESIKVEQSILDKAISEDIAVLSSPLTSYKLIQKLSSMGVEA